MKMCNWENGALFLITNFAVGLFMTPKTSFSSTIGILIAIYGGLPLQNTLTEPSTEPDQKKSPL